MKSEVIGSPVVCNKKIIIGTKSGDVYCFNSAPKLLWSYKTGSAIFSSPVFDSAGDILMSLYSGKLVKLSVLGKKLMEIDLGVKFRSTPMLIGNMIILISEKGRVMALKSRKWEMIWEKKLENECFSSPVYNKKTIYIPMKNNSLVAMSVDGEKKWEFKTEGVIFSSPAVGSDGSIYLTSMDHYLYKISSKGELVWKFKTDKWVISSPVIDSGENVYFGSYDRFFYSVNKEGKLRWKKQGRGAFNSTPVIDSADNVYTGNSSGYVYGFSNRGKILWKYKVGDFVRRPLTIMPDKKILIVSSLDRNIYAFGTDFPLSDKAVWPKYLRNSFNSGKRSD